MALLAIALPILPGQTPEWRQFVKELAGPRKREFEESRRRHGVHERTFFQPTPMGDLVIATLEGDDPHPRTPPSHGRTTHSSGGSTSRSSRSTASMPARLRRAPPELIADSGPIHKG
jgi:hypothetical protein